MILVFFLKRKGTDGYAPFLFLNMNYSFTTASGVTFLPAPPFYRP